MTDYHLAMLPARHDRTAEWETGLGAGPYRIVENEPGVGTKLVRPEGWHREGAYFDGVGITILNDPAARQTALLTGSADTISSVDLKTLGLLGRNPNIEIDNVPSGSAVTLRYHHTAGSKREALNESSADELADVVRERCPSNRIPFDHLEPDRRSALEARRVKVSFGQNAIERARCIKTPEELTAQRRSALVCETALRAMKEQTRRGVSENELWSTLVAINSRFGGDYIETRPVVSGTSTNPWYTESGERQIQAGELLAIDTDMVGPFGYATDISRTWLCHPATPTDGQKTLCRLAHEQVHENLALRMAGLSFREFSERAWKMPGRDAELDCGVLVHGIGMCNEYPQVPPLDRFERTGYDGHFETDMTLSVESCIGEPGGARGGKLEEMVRITDTGTELVAEFPFGGELPGA